jgi:hypothetical protein
VRLVPNWIFWTPIVKPVLIGKFCSPPLENTASASLLVMTVDCLSTFAQP